MKKTKRTTISDTQKAMLKAIYAKPADDTRRLAYADLLDECGGAMNCAQAEFTRLQIGLVTMPKHDSRRKGLEAKAEKLLATNRDAWLGEFKDVAPPDRLEFERGFPAELDCRNYRVTDTNIRCRAQSLRKLTSLSLRDAEVTSAAWKEIAKLTMLTKLTLGEAELTNDAWIAIAELTNLTSLDLGNTEVTESGWKEIAKLKNLTFLDLSSCRVTAAGWKEIAKLTMLTKLILGGGQVPGAGWNAIGQLTNLTTLDLGSTKVSDTGCNASNSR